LAVAGLLLWTGLPVGRGASNSEPPARVHASAAARPVGGVRIESLRIDGRPVTPEIAEVPEIQATLVIVRKAGSTDLLGLLLDAVFPPVLAAEEGRTPASHVKAGSQGFHQAGVYYVRLFLGLGPDLSAPQEQGVMGPPDLQVVPLRENEVWGKRRQEEYLERTFGLGTVHAVDGARVEPDDESGVAEGEFLTGVAGRLYRVVLKASAAGVEDEHRMRIRLSAEDGPDRLDASVIVENGRIVVLGVPDADGDAMLFLALSPRFADFARPDDEEILLCKGDVRPPEKIKDVKPVYPERARKEGVQGRVILEAVIRKSGRVDGVKVLRTPSVPGGELLVAAAADAVRRWEYLPARHTDGKAVHVYFTVIVEFRLEGDPPGSAEVVG
jgi:TonB family protein